MSTAAAAPRPRARCCTRARRMYPTVSPRCIIISRELLTRKKLRLWKRPATCVVYDCVCRSAAAAAPEP
ncbi:hypothetical protein ACLOJK_041211 [Asimina triloba]